MTSKITPITRGDSETAYVCITRSDGSKVTALAGFDADDKSQAVRYYDPQENEVPFDEATETVTWGSCPIIQVDCVESLEYTYGLDNTGTTFSDTATYEIEFSDGQILTFDQTPTGGWSAQLTQWATAIQAALDDVQIVGFAEPRFVDNPNPSNIDGTINGPGGTPSGLPGAPSSRIAELLIAGGMSWRYVNFQMCAGQPVPVGARRVASAIYGNEEYLLNTAGPIKGTINKFYVCRECGKDPVWYLDDNVTVATAGQIPDCFTPCGLLELQAPPPGSDCQFEFDTACDNNGSTDPAMYTSLITRRVTYCEGEQVNVAYYQPDPADASALLPYTLVGDYVDCVSGETVVVPPDETECTLKDLAGECGEVQECTEIGSVSGTNNGLGIGGSGTATHSIKHAASSQAITDQVASWLSSGYVVVVAFAGGATAVVDTQGFYSATNATFTATADHTQPDPCALFLQAADGNAVSGEAVTYTAYSVAGEAVEPEKVLKTEITCQRNPLEVVIVEDRAPSKASNVLQFCDDVNGDGSNIVIYYQTQTIIYDADGTPTNQPLSAPYDANLDPYTPVNPQPCDPEVVGAEPQFFCDDGTTFIRYISVLNGAPVIVAETEQDGVTTYAPQGPVTAGVCPLVAGVPEVHQPAIAGFSGAVTANGYPTLVESITVSVIRGTVSVNGVSLPRGTWTWGQGDQNYLDASALTFVGDNAASEFVLHWEAV